MATQCFDSWTFSIKWFQYHNNLLDIYFFFNSISLCDQVISFIKLKYNARCRSIKLSTSYWYSIYFGFPNHLQEFSEDKLWFRKPNRLVINLIELHLVLFSLFSYLVESHHQNIFNLYYLLFNLPVILTVGFHLAYYFFQGFKITQPRFKNTWTIK